MDTYKVTITDAKGDTVLELTATPAVVATNLRAFADELAPKTRRPRGSATPAE